MTEETALLVITVLAVMFVVCSLGVFVLDMIYDKWNDK